MISVLIPIYNYSVVSLVKTIHGQLTKCGLPFEIIGLEDGSDEEFVKENSTITALLNTRLLISKINIGRIQSRQLLSKRAQYEWLLFLDSDVMPKSNRFILNYLECDYTNHDAIYGGFAYQNTRPDPQLTLRWKYGRTYETVDARIRNRKPYKVVISANFLIRKHIYNTISPEIHFDAYGTDNVMGLLLKKHSIKVLHINNEVYHFGLEKNEVYLRKKERAADLLLNLINEKELIKSDNSLLSLFIILKQFGLHYPLLLIFRIFGKAIKHNLIGKKPILPLLQLYRISYMCNAYITSKL